MKRTPFRVKLLLIVAVPTIVVGLPACDNKSSELETLRRRVTTLEAELDSCANDPPKLLQTAKSFFEWKDFEQVIATAETLNKKHSGSPEAIEVNALAERAKRQIADQKREQEAKAALARAEEERKTAIENAAKDRELNKAMSNMVKKKDDMRGIVFYKHKAAPQFINSRSVIEPYIAVDQSGRPHLVWHNVYVADDWLFISSYLIKADNSTFDITPSFGEIKRDHGSGEIWEWTDDAVTGDIDPMLRAVASSKKATIRYIGQQYYKDRILGGPEKRMIGEVLSAYQALSKK